MNCKQGDVAYVCKSAAGNYGRVVTCLKLHPTESFGFDKSVGPLWEVDQPMKSVYTNGVPNSKLLYFMADSYLRPIRGDLTNDDVDTQINREAETC